VRPVLIIGGGISGLSAAYYLRKRGIPPAILEKQARLGGVVSTEVVEGCVVEGGPDSFLAAKPAAMDLIRELGIESEVIGSNDQLRVTYIKRGGRLVPLPDGLMMMVPTKLWPMAATDLLGWKTKVRMALEYFRSPGPPGVEDRSVSDFIADHYGSEAVEYLAEPLLAGVFGGSPDELSVGSVLPRFVEIEAKYGSLTRGMLAAPRPAAGAGTLFRTMKRGLRHLAEAVSDAAHPEVIRGEADTVERIAGGWRVRTGGEWLEAKQAIVALPAHAAAGVVSALDPELARSLGAIPYSSSMTVALGYRKDRLGHPQNGFGFLIPRRERRRMIACTWVGTKFDHRVPATHALLRCFFGGSADGAILEESDDAVIAIAREELREIMGVGAEPEFTRISRWPRSMAQYTVGHAGTTARIEERMRGHAGLQLIGNAYSGIGIPDCIKMGNDAARRCVTMTA
jgi:oxygen-dependent protoporphyrinogen oxidase